MFEMCCHLILGCKKDAGGCRLNDADPTFIVVIALQFRDFYLVDVAEPCVWWADSIESCMISSRSQSGYGDDQMKVE